MNLLPSDRRGQSPQPERRHYASTWARLREWERRDDLHLVSDIDDMTDAIVGESAEEGMGAEGDA